MSSTGRADRPRWPLVADTVRAHRWGGLAWIGGSAVAMVAIAAGFASEVARFPGGAPAMAESMRPGVEAMRLLRWPAERLDTLGGYLTYHNVTLFALALTLYAAVQGAHAVRGAEARGVPAEILAAGRSRVGVLVDRATGFALTLALIGLGLGAGLAVAMAVGGEPAAGGSFVTGAAVALCAFVGYAFGVLVSQVTPSVRAGSGLATLLLAALYVLTNVWADLGPLGAVRFVSPFYAADLAYGLVPGRAPQAGPALGLVMAGVALLAGAAWAYQRRDEGAGLWHRSAPGARPAARVRVQRPALRRGWSAALLRQRLGLLTWSALAAVTLALMGWLEPTVTDMWNEFQYTQRMLGSVSTASLADQYLAFAGQLVVPIVAAYVITQAAGWVADLRQGRVELLLAGPLSWPRLVAHRLVATLAGAAAITGAAIAGLAVSAVAVGAGLNAAGLARLAGVTLLFAAALAGVAALVVAWLRTGAAVAVLATLVGASYLLMYLVPLFGWPAWVTRATVFGAYGNPYLEIPAWTGLVVLGGLALLGGSGAAAVARRSPKVAT